MRVTSPIDNMVIMFIYLPYIKIDPNRADGDDSVVNVIRLLCKQAWDDFPVSGSVVSATESWGQV